MRLPFLHKGIAQKLANATNGLGIVLEHRYYGNSPNESAPVPDLATENLRFLDTQQALADTNYFAKNIKFEGLEHLDLTAGATPWIVYGGSYAGAFSAFLRKLYPETFYGAIASSAVTKPILDYSDYWEPIRLYSEPQSCITRLQDFIQVVDGILIDRNRTYLTNYLLRTFGFDGLKDPRDFADAINEGGLWQNRNWDPAVDDTRWLQYCRNITSPRVLYPETEKLRRAVSVLTYASRRVQYPSSELVNGMLNWIGYLNLTKVAPCAEQNQTSEECFGSNDTSDNDNTSSFKSVWRKWGYQVCTQWGFFQTGSGISSDVLPIVSRTLDLDWSMKFCRLSYNLTGYPNLDEIDQYGGFNISMDRLAFIDGQADPWLYATPHAPAAPPRKDSVNRPYVLIDKGVHHWDENGLFPDETTSKLPPEPVRITQEYEIEFVKAWLGEYEEMRWAKEPDNSLEL